MLFPILEQLNVLGNTLIVFIPQLSDEPLLISLAFIVLLPVASSCTVILVQTALGFVTSFAVNTTVLIFVFPAASVAVTVTLIVPFGDETTTAPTAGLCVITVPVQLSVAVPLTFGIVAEQAPLSVTF